MVAGDGFILKISFHFQIPRGCEHWLFSHFQDETIEEWKDLT